MDGSGMVMREEEGQAAATSGPAAAEVPGVDVNELANRVYKLFLAEARLGRARTELGDVHVGAMRREE